MNIPHLAKWSFERVGKEADMIGRPGLNAGGYIGARDSRGKGAGKNCDVNLAS